ncbi:hypothetical protein [Deinococcus pimensis]|uniref:hypothetical protein n=1 Tax=Deinococcus pimensis TaxID=309888 RepID=UPI0005EBD5ED|nr:hypothetical protein [Deinococcus pimensis]
MRRVLLHLLLTPAALLPCGALAHGDDAPTDLRGTRPCLSANSVKVTYEGATTDRQKSVRSAVQRDTAAALRSALKAGGVPTVTRDRCAPGEPTVTLAVSVRYLDPARYVGFGDPAYSYELRLLVTRGASPRPAPARFVAGYADIHSEAREKRPFETALRVWTKELGGDLAQAWKKDNAPGKR